MRIVIAFLVIAVFVVMAKGSGFSRAFEEVGLLITRILRKTNIDKTTFY